MAFHRSPKIVTNGIRFYIDAYNIKSYKEGDFFTYNLVDRRTGSELVNGVTFSENSFIFDGVDSFINVEPTAPGEIFTTFECWFKANTSSSGSSNDRILAGGFLPGGRSINYINNRIFVNFGADDGVQSSQNIELNTWYHLVVMYDVSFSNSYKIYINAEDVSTESTIETKRVSSEKVLGCRYRNIDNYTRFFSGNISQVKCYNRVLTKKEIKQNFISMKKRYL